MNHKQSMRKHVYQTLKEAILFRKIAPGTQLVEQVISEKLDVSRTPIRNAISDLEDEGLVTVYPNRGAFVTVPTAVEIEQAYIARKELERAASQLAILKINQKDIEHLRLLITKEKESYKKKDILEYLRINKEFHMELAKKSENKFFIDFIEKMLNQINVYLMLYDVFYDVDIENSQRYLEHEEIVDAIEAKDINKLYHLFDKHMEKSLSYMNLEKNNYSFFDR